MARGRLARIRSGWPFAALATALVSSACTGPGPGPVYDRDLGAAIERLKADVEAQPTDESTVAARAAVVADWADALSLAGHEMGLDGALGTLAAESLGPFEARQYATLSQTWTAGTRPVETGGGFWVARHFNANYGVFQTDDPAAAGYVTIGTDAANVRFETDVYMASGPHGGFRAPEPALAFRVAEGRLEPGESVTITYGDTTGGGPGVMMTQTSGARTPFPLYGDLDGAGPVHSVPNSTPVTTAAT